MRGLRRPLRNQRHLLVAALLVLAPLPLAAQPAPQKKLEEVERDLKATQERQKLLEAEAARMEAELRGLRQKSVTAARLLQRQEASVTALEERMARNRTEASTKEAALGERRAELAATLGGLVRLSRQPPETVLFAPGSAIDAVRSSQLISATVPQIESRAAALKRELAELAELRATLERDQEAMGREVARLDDERKSLAALQAEVARTWERTAGAGRDESRRAEILADEAKELRALIQRLREEEERREAEEKKRQAELARERAREQAREQQARERAREAPREPERQAALPPPARDGAVISLPAQGRVTGRFGDTDRNGQRRRGIDLETRVNGQVVAPGDGKVVFAGQFKGYGLLLIISHGGGYHSLLAGLERIDASVGRSVAAGEPVGRMGGSEAEKPVLYVEVRRQGEPVNPIPWLAAGERKVSG
jgi:septal ring factor EnvC (AmiA/AmiB activator)